MKQLTFIQHKFKSLFFLLILAFSSCLSYAQDKGADINVNVNKGGGGGWYAQPWVWIVGGAIFLLLLVAILRGGGNRN